MTHFHHAIKFEHRVNGLLHCEDGPAIEYVNGTRKWYRNGLLHREDAPAIEYWDDISKEWWVNGIQHREDGPAVIHANIPSYTCGRKIWMLHGKMYRKDDGPVMEWSDGRKLWYVNGKYTINRSTSNLQR